MRYTSSVGGKRIAEQVRRALTAAAKRMPLVLAIDASGCTDSGECAAPGGPPPCPVGPAKLVPVNPDAGAPPPANLSVCPIADPGFDKQHGGYWDTGNGPLVAYGWAECSLCASDCISYGLCLAAGVASQWVQCMETCKDGG